MNKHRLLYVSMLTLVLLMALFGPVTSAVYRIMAQERLLERKK